MDDSQKRIEIALRAGLLAKAALELINLEPKLVRLQLAEIVKQIQQIERAAK